MPLPHTPEENAAGCKAHADTLKGCVRRHHPILRSQANAPCL